MADLNILQSTVFSRIKDNFPKTIKVNKQTIKMTDDNFSTVGSSDTPAVFPFVYVKLLPGVEQEGYYFISCKYSTDCTSYVPCRTS